MNKTNDEKSRTALPLNSIRVFVEAARQLNFSRAAQTLGMTQGGVSHHVSSLEDYFGHRLFVRLGSSVALTDAGRLYFDTVQEALSTIELSTRQLRQRSGNSGRLCVRTSVPTFAMMVLIPALSRFCPAPSSAVDVVTSLSPPAVGDIYDVLITRDLVQGDDGHWQLATEQLVCVAAPSLLAEFSAKPIGDWPFLATRSRPDVLSEWANRQGVEANGIHVAATFDHYFLALPAAIGGMGFLAMPRLLVIDALRQEHLLEAPTPTVRGSASYKAYINPCTSEMQAAKAFCRWLKGELRENEETAS
jgi:DNA-binding transcriptional LysR family regulator